MGAMRAKTSSFDCPARECYAVIVNGDEQERRGYGGYATGGGWTASSGAHRGAPPIIGIPPLPTGLRFWFSKRRVRHIVTPMSACHE